MNKVDLVASVSTMTSLSNTDAEAAVNAVFSTIADALGAGETVRLAGFGTFSTRFQPARQCRNLRTGEKIIIAASNTPSLKAGKTVVS